MECEVKNKRGRGRSCSGEGDGKKEENGGKEERKATFFLSVRNI